MIQRAFWKDFWRTLGKSVTRFLSILAITALGVGFYAGITATEPDMILSADRYYQAQNLADFSILSPLGFRPEDIEQIRQLPGIQTAEPRSFKDVFLADPAGRRLTVRLTGHDANDTLNRPLLLDGRLPEASGEIVLEGGGELNMTLDIPIGAILTASVPNGEKISDSLAGQTFTVVGHVQSPKYISMERGQTNIGDGSIDAYGLVSAADFVVERAMLVEVRTAASRSLVAYSEDYSRHLDELEPGLLAMGQAAVGAETAELRAELQENKDKLLGEKRQAEQKLVAAGLALRDAELQIGDGERELAEQEAIFRAELLEGETELEDGRKIYYDGVLDYLAGHDRWLAGYMAWQDSRAQLQQAQAELDQGKLKLEQGEKDLADAKLQLDAAREQLALLEQAITALRQIRAGIPASPGPGLPEAEFKRLLSLVREFSPELADYIETYYDPSDPDMLDQLRAFLDTSLAQLERTYQEGLAEYEAGLAEYEAGQQELARQKTAYEAGLAEVKAGQASLDKAKVQIDSGKAELDLARRRLDQAKVKLDAGELDLIRGELELDEELARGRAELEAARQELAEGRREYEAGKETLLAEIAKAEAEIREAQRQLVEIPQEWFVSTREANPGYSGFGDDAARIGAVARIFPVFFFLVAALVCLTTMTRMVEEERTQIGTLKALGYSTFAISAKYLAYALLASVSGSVIGLLTGFWIFPATIMNAYAIMYAIPEFITPPHVITGLLATGLALATTLLAALSASLNALKAVPAVLMQPKAPRPGKRIMLEQITPLWKRLSFSQKLAARNVFRYKQRLLMTVIGIAGCTALLLTGFGLKDSINAIVGKQFDEIFLYDGLVMSNTEKDGAEAELDAALSSEEGLESYLKTRSESVAVVVGHSSQTHAATLLVPSQSEPFERYFDLHERVSGRKLSLNSGGVIVSEKLADLLSLDVGDAITFRDTENRTYSAPVSGIAENYLTHYLFMSPQTFDQITFRTPESNGAVFILKDPDSFDASAFQERLLSHDTILGSMLTLSLAEEFAKTIGSLDLVVLVLIAAAGALAFVVLYNLISINITERIREIATIKVLGFRDREVSLYVFRENIVLTLIGTLAGLLLGVTLHRFVMDTMEIDSIMFGKTIHWTSFLFSLLLTALFSILVNAVMHGRLRKIKMVESLKSVE